jgi:hypothetical protein
MPYSQYTGNAVSLLLLVSPLGLLMWALRARQLRQRFEHPSVVALVEVVVVLNAVGVLAITLLSPGGNGQPLDLNPLSGDIQSASSRAQLIGNALLFAPLGLLGGLRFTALPRGELYVSWARSRLSALSRPHNMFSRQGESHPRRTCLLAPRVSRSDTGLAHLWLVRGRSATFSGPRPHQSPYSHPSHSSAEPDVLECRGSTLGAAGSWGRSRFSFELRPEDQHGQGDHPPGHHDQARQRVRHMVGALVKPSGADDQGHDQQKSCGRSPPW